MDLEEIRSEIQHRQSDILGSSRLVKFAVLLPLIEKDGEIHILFEVRSLSMRRQPGEICFPGGKMDQDDVDLIETAKRETSEELGIPIGEVSVFSELDYVVTPYDTVIYPFVGTIESISDLKLNPEEVDQIFTVPLAYFLKEGPSIHYIEMKPEPNSSFPYHLIPNGEKYKWQTRRMQEIFYTYKGHVIWGLTAKILYHFLTLIQGENK